MSTLKLDANDTQFVALATSLGFTEMEGRYLVRGKPLSADETERVRDALQGGMFKLYHAEVRGSA
jgi:hypothetical protein